MTATNIFYNFVGFRYSPPLRQYKLILLGQSAILFHVFIYIFFLEQDFLYHYWLLTSLLVENAAAEDCSCLNLDNSCTGEPNNVVD